MTIWGRGKPLPRPFEVTNVDFLLPGLRIMDAFGGVGGIFSALLQTGNYQLGTGTLAAGSGRNIVLVAACLSRVVSNAPAPTSLYFLYPALFMLTPGTSAVGYHPMYKQYSLGSGVVPINDTKIIVTSDSITGDNSIPILYLYTI